MATEIGAARHWLDAPLGAPLPLGSEFFEWRGGRQDSDMTCREDGTARVIASQRVRPEVAGPMINSAKQSRAARARIWIASSLPLLAMTRMRTFTSPRRGRSPGQRKPRRGTRGSEPKAATVPVARPATRHGKTRAQTRRGNNDARRAHCCNAVASNGRASDRQTNVQLLESV